MKSMESFAMHLNQGGNANPAWLLWFLPLAELSHLVSGGISTFEHTIVRLIFYNHLFNSL